MKEADLFEYLKSNLYPDLVKSPGTFDTFDSNLLKTKTNSFYPCDLETLEYGNKLNDTIINSYFELIATSNQKKCLALSSFVFLDSTSPDRVVNWYNKHSSESYDFYLISIFDEKICHWSVVIINCARKSIMHYDSLLNSSVLLIRRIKSVLSTVFDQLKNIKYWTIEKESPSIPRQKNTIDCGVFICLFTRLYCQSSIPIQFSNVDIVNFRKHIKSEIFTNEILNFTISKE